MRARELPEHPVRRHVLVLAPGEEVMETLLAYARERSLRAGHFVGLGALEAATLGFFDPATREYRTFEVADQVEVLSLVGNISWFQEQPRLHAHIVVGFHDGRTLGGHVVAARVRPTLEVILVEAGGELRR